MKNQIWFQTDLGYEATKERFQQSRSIVGDMQAYRGRLTFYLKVFKDATFQITTKGKLGIWYPDEVGYEGFLEQLKPLLVKADGNPSEKFIVIRKPSKSRRNALVDQKVKNAIEYLRFILMRDPTILEVAYKMGKTPEAIRETAFKLSPKIGWKEPSEKQISRADDKIKEIYKIARLLHHFAPEIVQKRHVFCLNDESWNTILNRVNYARKYEPGEVPKIVSTKKDERQMKIEYRWPKGSKWYGSNGSEYYDKENKRLVSAEVVFMKGIMKRTDQLLEEIKKSRES